MRILHTSDWHLGRSFGSVPLLDDQQAFLEWLASVVRSEGIDLVVVAGDIYDRAVANTEAVVMFRDVLRRLVATAKVAVITGNHDGSDRVNTYGALLDISGVLLRGGYEGVGDVITLDMGDGPLDLVLLPFLDPQAAPDEFGVTDGGPAEPTGDAFERRVRRTHHSVLDLATRRALLRSPRSLAVAHAFVAGGAESDSERQLTVGGTGAVDAALFERFSYTALGHLHRPQQLSSSIRYSGAPLPYSFSEAHAKSVTIVDMTTAGACTIQEVNIPIGRPVLTVTGEIAELLAIVPGDAERRSFVRAIVTDPGVVLDAKTRLAAVYPHVVEIVLQPPLGSDSGAAMAPNERIVLSAAEIADRFWEASTGAPPEPDEQLLLRTAIAAAERTFETEVV